MRRSAAKRRRGVPAPAGPDSSATPPAESDRPDQGQLFELRAPTTAQQPRAGGHRPPRAAPDRRTTPGGAPPSGTAAQGGDPGGGAARPLVEVRRSARRRRTVSAYRDGERTIVLLPAGLSAQDERAWVERMLARLQAQEQRRRPSDGQLLDRTLELSARYLDGRAVPTSVRWVDNQGRRWGSCTPADATIRLSSRLRGMPGWVVDYVIVHELVHLLVPSHGPDFWALVAAYPRSERARGYLDGVAAASGLDIAEDVD